MCDAELTDGWELEGVWKITESTGSVATGIYLLFARGKRPDRAAIKAFVAAQQGTSISHDPSGNPALQLVTADGRHIGQGNPEEGPNTNAVWMELLRDGLTFDLEGLAPGETCAFPKANHRFDLEDLPSAANYDALVLEPGHHLAGGERTMPVVKGLVGLARELIHHFDDLLAVVWPPAASAIGRRYFESVAAAWLEGGPFPALGLTSFRETIDGALQSEGLSFWIDQELRLEPPLSADKLYATRMGVRLIIQLILVGGVDGSERIIAPDGSRLVLRTSRNGQFIRVWRE